MLDQDTIAKLNVLLAEAETTSSDVKNFVSEASRLQKESDEAVRLGSAARKLMAELHDQLIVILPSMATTGLVSWNTDHRGLNDVPSSEPYLQWRASRAKDDQGTEKPALAFREFT